jgi:hypothetical protein
VAKRPRGHEAYEVRTHAIIDGWRVTIYPNFKHIGLWGSARWFYCYIFGEEP